MRSLSGRAGHEEQFELIREMQPGVANREECMDLIGETPLGGARRGLGAGNGRCVV